LNGNGGGPRLLRCDLSASAKPFKVGLVLLAIFLGVGCSDRFSVTEASRDRCPIGGLTLLAEDGSASTMCQSNEDMPLTFDEIAQQLLVDVDGSGDGGADERVDAAALPRDGGNHVVITCLRDRYAGSSPYPVCDDRDKNVAVISDLTEINRITTAADADALRRGLRRQYFGVDTLPTRLPDVVEEDVDDDRWNDLDGLAEIVHLTVSQRGGLDSHAVALRPSTPNGDIAVYHEGHDGDPVRRAALVQDLVSAGYLVVALAMPLRGPNPLLEQSGGEPTRSHFRLFDQVDDAQRLFMEPVVVAINWATREAPGTVAMLGLSGGGWSSVVAAALDERIVTTVSVAGSYPLFGRLRPEDDWGDSEQNDFSLMQEANYLELYSLAAQRRRLIHIYNRDDSCCFSGEGFRVWDTHLADVATVLDGDASVVLDTTIERHDVSPFARALALELLEG